MTQTKQPLMLDLDAVAPETEIVVKLDGQEHKLVPITLEDYIANTRLIQSLGQSDGNFEAEFDASIAIVGRAFPTIGEERLRKLTLQQLNAIVQFAMKNNGSDEVSDEAAAEAAQGNPPTTTAN